MKSIKRIFSLISPAYIFFAGILPLLLLVSCKPPKGVDEKSFREQQWKRSNIHSYEFLFRINCFCGPEITGPHRIEVRSDTIYAVNGIPFNPAENYIRLMTINDLFRFIRESDGRNPFRKSVQYDSAYGFPQSLYYDFDRRIADEEIGYIITEFRRK